jgi:hypothetical protein
MSPKDIPGNTYSSTVIASTNMAAHTVPVFALLQPNVTSYDRYTEDVRTRCSEEYLDIRGNE